MVRRVNRWTWIFVAVLFLPGLVLVILRVAEVGLALILASMVALGVGTFTGLMATSVGRGAF